MSAERLLLLTLPSAAILGALMAHSARFLGRTLAVWFWGLALAYGVARGMAVRFVTIQALGAAEPYRIHEPLLQFRGVSAQEVAGFAIVAYLGLWLGSRRGEPVGACLLRATLFLGAIAVDVEAAAIAAGWWHWTVPLSSRLPGAVPFIAIVDWGFVATDLLLPFSVLAVPALRKRPLAWLSLASFPVHFAAHAFTADVSRSVPIPVVHGWHWALAAIVVSLAVSGGRAALPVRRVDGWWRWVPAAAIALVLLNTALVHLLLVRDPRGLVALVPVLAACFVPLPRPGPRRRRWAVAAVLATTLTMAIAVHRRAAAREEALTRTLDAALARRGGGDLAGASALLQEARREHPGSHVPSYLLAELELQAARVAEARPLLREVIAIKQDFLPAYQRLAAAALAAGDHAEAAAVAARGRAIDGGDLVLAYLQAKAERRAPESLLPALHEAGALEIEEVAAVADAVGDGAFAARCLDEAIEAWPRRRFFYAPRARIAAEQRDDAALRRTVLLWRARFPSDPQAAALARRLGLP